MSWRHPLSYVLSNRLYYFQQVRSGDFLHIHVLWIAAQDKQGDGAKPDVAVETLKIPNLVGGASCQGVVFLNQLGIAFEIEPLLSLLHSLSSLKERVLTSRYQASTLYLKFYVVFFTPIIIMFLKQRSNFTVEFS